MPPMRPTTFMARDIDDVDAVGAAARDIKQLVVRAEHHAARPRAGLDDRDRRVVGRVQHRDAVALFVADEQMIGAGESGEAKTESRDHHKF